MNKEKLLTEFMLFIKDEYIEKNYPEIRKILTKKLKKAGINVKKF